MKDYNLFVACLALATTFGAALGFYYGKRERKSDEPYSEEPTEAGRKFMDDPNENGVTGL